jgi:hypothetical protein
VKRSAPLSNLRGVQRSLFYPSINPYASNPGYDIIGETFPHQKSVVS